MNKTLGNYSKGELPINRQQTLLQLDKTTYLISYLSLFLA